MASAHVGHGSQVSVGDGRFTQATVKIRAGATVTWHWDWPGDWTTRHAGPPEPRDGRGFPGDPTPVGSRPGDLTVSEVRVNAVRRRVGYTLSFDARVRVRVAKRVRSNWSVLRAFDVDAAAGRNRVTLRSRPFPPGAYRVRLAARDGAGNRSDALVTRFRVNLR